MFVRALPLDDLRYYCSFITLACARVRDSIVYLLVILLSLYITRFLNVRSVLLASGDQDAASRCGQQLGTESREACMLILWPGTRVPCECLERCQGLQRRPCSAGPFSGLAKQSHHITHPQCGTRYKARARGHASCLLPVASCLSRPVTRSSSVADTCTSTPCSYLGQAVELAAL